MRGEKLLLLVCAVCCLFGLTGCWDLAEVNQLAIGSLAGGDVDPKTNNQIVYYHIINPSAIAAQRGTTVKAPVYSYRVEAPTLAQLSKKSSDVIPRELFPDQFQSYLVSERFARQGLEPFINFIERQYNRRTDLYLLVTDTPMEEMMDTFTLLEKVPGRYLRSLVEWQAKSSSTVSLKSRIKDLIENMESSRLTVLPLVSLHQPTQADNTARYEKIDGSKSSIQVNGGAVFNKDTMIGKLDLLDVSVYHLLKGDTKIFYSNIELPSGPVDLSATKIKSKKRLSLVEGKPVLEVNLRASLVILNNEQKVKLTTANVAEIKEAFNDQIKALGEAFFQHYTEKGWDLFGLEESVKNKRGEQWAQAREDNKLWRKTIIRVQASSTLRDVGGAIDPYKGAH
ncbi:Ger(x)C family spore germination protein [Paenibacillus hodogayensis]